MEENIRVLDGDELFGNRNSETSKSDNHLLWCGVGILGLLLLGVCVWVAYDAGKETVMPAVTGVTKENDELKHRISECPYFQMKNNNGCGQQNKNQNA